MASAGDLKGSRYAVCYPAGEMNAGTSYTYPYIVPRMPSTGRASSVKDTGGLLLRWASVNQMVYLAEDNLLATSAQLMTFQNAAI
jgi:hypothetical protein